MRRRLVAVAAAVIVLAGCNGERQGSDLAKAVSQAEVAEARNNSPDVAVKSWWELKDAGAALQIEICKSNLGLTSSYLDKLSELSTDEVYVPRGCGQGLPVFDRQITKVDIQSDTRAIVTALIKNVTPPEDGAVFDRGDKEAKEKGKPFQYILERADSGSGWRISQVSHYPSYARSWERVFEKPKPSTNRWVNEWHH